LREAIRMGKERKKRRLVISFNQFPSSTGEELESLLYCILRDVRALRGRLAA
jgi:hypothetical protein